MGFQTATITLSNAKGFGVFSSSSDRAKNDFKKYLGVDLTKLPKLMLVLILPDT